MSRQKIVIPPEMMEKYIYMYACNPVKLSDGRINGGCPVCREGSSWGRKKRMYYYPEESSVYCFNCNKSWQAISWIMEVTGKTFNDIIKEAKEYSFISSKDSTVFFDNLKKQETIGTANGSDLPKDPIVIDSSLQKLYYANNQIVKSAYEFVKRRLLDKAVNVPKYSISLTDPVHKNRLIIPFTDLDGSISFYQTRKLNNDDFLPKYLSKKNSEKTVFGIDKIDIDFPYIFITEGPIDSCFIKNGISIAGLKYSDTQLNQLSNFFMHKKIWVLDNDFSTNETVFGQYMKLINDGETVFIWPENMSSFKDVNEYCISANNPVFNHEMIIENSFTGLMAKQKLMRMKLK